MRKRPEKAVSEIMKYKHVEIQNLEVQNAHLIADPQNCYPSTFLLGAECHLCLLRCQKIINQKEDIFRKYMKAGTLWLTGAAMTSFLYARPSGILRYLYAPSS
jgi:hypothetical protein